MATLACLIGRHHYGEDHGVGSEILRRVCRGCGAVTIDLRGAGELSDPLVQTRQGRISPGSDR